jgi:hypothetical protein
VGKPTVTVEDFDLVLVSIAEFGCIPELGAFVLLGYTASPVPKLGHHQRPQLEDAAMSQVVDHEPSAGLRSHPRVTGPLPRAGQTFLRRAIDKADGREDV